MTKRMVALLCALGGLVSADAKSITITDQVENLVVEKGVDLVADKKGFILSQEVVLPLFEKGAYYRPYSGGPARGNRVEAVAFDSVKSLQSYKPSLTRKGHTSVQQGQLVLLKINDSKYVTLLPMVSRDVYCQFFMEKGKMILKAGSFGTQQVTGDLPLLIWAYGSSPYAATKAAWKVAIESGHIAADWRSSKPFPEMHAHLGWCSWEHYKQRISEKIIIEAVHTIEECGAPIRWVMVDDGYLTHQKNRIINFTPVVRKFPNGWEAITSLKNPDKIKWMGIWRNMLGYMASISPEHTMTELADYLVPDAKGKCMLPAETPEASKAFYDKMILDSKENGFDFTKVDFQTRGFDAYKGMKNAVRASRNNNEALEAACKKFDIPLLNCIAQPNVNSLQTQYSALTRSSPDYNQTDKNKNKCNTYQSFANHLWMGQTVWGDLDMFHTHDERDVHSMALARAISGGPVYISDEPSKIVPEVLAPFATADGKLLRTKAPATLLPESFFIHPFRGSKPFRVIAPMEDGVAAIALFNFTEGDQALTASFSAKDYPFAGELLQPAEAWTLPKEGLLVYDRNQKQVTPLAEGFRAEIGNFDAELFLLYPQTQGWAVIGRIDKYLPAAAVKIKSVSAKKIAFTLKESGPLAIWSNNGAPKLKGVQFELIGKNLYGAELSITAGEKEITVTR